jgi:hypothetical protein
MSRREKKKRSLVKSPSVSEAGALPHIAVNRQWLLVCSIAALSAASALFAWKQNHLGGIGGPISLAKTLWLNYMLIAMYIVPFFLWRKSTLAPATRRLFGAIFLSFAVRAPIELWIIYYTRAWRCGYGIAHDVFTILLIIFLRREISPDVVERDSATMRVATLLQIMLAVEIFMAWEFSLLASPAQGIYFAADTPHFRFVNIASWIAVSFGYPALLYLLWRSRNEHANA